MSDSSLVCSNDTCQGDTVAKDRTTGLSQALLVLFTVGLHSWNFPGWSQREHSQGAQGYMKKLEIGKHQCLSEMRSPTHRRSKSWGGKRGQGVLETCPVLCELSTDRWGNIHSENLKRTGDQSFVWDLRQWDSPSPAPINVDVVLKIVSPAKSQEMFFLCLSPKLLHYGHKWYTHFKLSTCRTLLINHQLSPFPQQSQGLVNPALHRSLQAGLTNKHT